MSLEMVASIVGLCGGQSLEASKNLESVRDVLGLLPNVCSVSEPRIMNVSVKMPFLSPPRRATCCLRPDRTFHPRGLTQKQWLSSVASIARNESQEYTCYEELWSCITHDIQLTATGELHVCQPGSESCKIHTCTYLQVRWYHATKF